MMNRKYFKTGWLLLPLLLVGISACERSNADNPVLPIISNAKAPVLHLAEGVKKDIAIDLDNLGVLELTWDAADLGEQIPVNYSLTATAGDKSVEFPTTAGSNKVKIDHKTLNEKALGDLGLEVDKKATITFVVTASPLLGSGSPALKDATVFSAPLEITLTPTKPKFPEKLYMIGQEFGSWNWDSDGVVEMTPVHSHPGMFWAVRHISDPANGFKWNTNRAWDGGEFNSLGNNVGFETPNNAVVDKPGIYMFFVDYTTKTITIEPAQVFGIGDAFGSWDAGKHPFEAEGGKMVGTTTGDGDLRIYATTSAASVDWWQMEFVILQGKIAYRGTGGDQERVPVTAGQKVTLDFNTGVGSIN